MNAFEAMTTILDINETVEKLKDNNKENEPNLINCKEVELLVKYRQLLLAEMERTILEVFRDDNK